MRGILPCSSNRASRDSCAGVHERIVGIAVRAAAEKGGAVRTIQWSAGAQALDQVRVGDIGPAEGDQVCAIGPARFERKCQVITVVGDVRPHECAPQYLQIEAGGHFPWTLRAPPRSHAGRRARNH